MAKEKRVRLRTLNISDAKAIYEYLKDGEVSKWTLIPQPYKRIDALKFVLKSQYKRMLKKEYVFGIILKETNHLVGVISLLNINWSNKNAELGYWLGKEYWGRGLTTEAIDLILNFAFKELNLHRIYAYVFEENIASRRVLEKNSFKLEGMRRGVKYLRNKWRNDLMFGILNGD